MTAPTSLVATLIAAGTLETAAVDRVRDGLPRAAKPQSLGPDAADIPFSVDEPVNQRALAAHLRALAAGPVDVVVQPLPDRRKKLFLADMDSTMIGQECIDELADYAGVKAYVAAITERAMRGEIAFEPALRERVSLLKGISLSVIDDVFEKRITLTPGARTLVATMRANGAFTCLVSGGFTLFTNRVAAMIGFDETRANTLELEGETLAGTVIEPIFGRESKLAALHELRAAHGLKAEETLVTGDGANDLAMIAEAGLGVAYHAKPKVAEAAAARIDHGDLTSLLYAQGYRRDEFVEA
jgi:phosphoserine phosphatase